MPESEMANSPETPSQAENLETPEAQPLPTWDPLSFIERRVLGVLIEKQKTSKSPDAYPMTLNALTTGCNQKSNRDPVTELSDEEVEETLRSLQKKGLTLKIVGGRVDRFKHTLYDTWKVTKVEMAILAELLLRGPQTEGDLRVRASRMDEIADKETLKELVKGLQERNLVLYLTSPDKRGAVLTHGFHPPEELETLRGIAGSAGFVPAMESGVPPRAGSGSLVALETRLNEAFEEIAKLREAVAKLEAVLLSNK